MCTPKRIKSKEFCYEHEQFLNENEKKSKKSVKQERRRKKASKSQSNSSRVHCYSWTFKGRTRTKRPKLKNEQTPKWFEWIRWNWVKEQEKSNNSSSKAFVTIIVTLRFSSKFMPRNSSAHCFISLANRMNELTNKSPT